MKWVIYDCTREDLEVLLTDSFRFLDVTFFVTSANLSAILLLISVRTLRLGLSFLAVVDSTGSSIFVVNLGTFLRLGRC